MSLFQSLSRSCEKLTNGRSFDVFLKKREIQPHDQLGASSEQGLGNVLKLNCAKLVIHYVT